LQAKKRKSPGDGKADGKAAGKAASKEKKPKCWVDMQKIYSCIANKCGSPAPSAVHAAVVLMLCAGTDFSRPIPLIGPKRIWDALPAVAPTLLQAAPIGTLDYALFSDGVIGVLYKTVFSRHVSSSTHGFGAVMHELHHTSSLSATTLGRLPSEGQLLTTLKNINWVANHYWTVINGPIHAPLDGSNGFVPSVRGGVVYEDLRAVKSS
jgi:hypothetical protein